MPSYLLTLLPILRASVSVPALIAPLTAASLFQLPNPATSALPLRMFAIRDTVLAGLLWTARHEDVATQRRALIAGLVVDAVDVASAVTGVVEGSSDARPARFLGAGAALLVLLGGLGLRATGPGVALK